MSNLAFDTLTTSKDLQRAGFEIQQAEAIALAIKNHQSDLATKADIESLRVEVKSLETKFETEMKSLETKFGTEMKSLERKFGTEMKSFKNEVRSSLSWLRWSMAAMMIIMVGGFTLIVTLPT